MVLEPQVLAEVSANPGVDGGALDLLRRRTFAPVTDEIALYEAARRATRPNDMGRLMPVSGGDLDPVVEEQKRQMGKQQLDALGLENQKTRMSMMPVPKRYATMRGYGDMLVDDYGGTPQSMRPNTQITTAGQDADIKSRATGAQGVSDSAPGLTPSNAAVIGSGQTAAGGQRNGPSDWANQMSAFDKENWQGAKKVGTPGGGSVMNRNFAYDPNFKEQPTEEEKLLAMYMSMLGGRR